MLNNEKIQIKMERSPFHKKRNMIAPRGSINVQAQISQDMFDDFMSFALRYNVEHDNPPKIKRNGEKQHNKANPLKHIINDFLNNHALERRCFDDLHVIMAFEVEAFETPFNTNVRHEVIGFVQEREKFTKHNPFTYRPEMRNRSHLLYMLEPFNKETFDMLNLKSLDRPVLFDVDPSTQTDFIDPAMYDDFEFVKSKLESMYMLHFDNAFICMFKVNNYLDILHDGVYVSKNSTYSHDGLVVMLDPDDIYMLDRIVARYTWSYNAGTFSFEFHVENYGDFNIETIYQAPRDVFVEYWNTSSGFLSQQAKLEMNLKHSRERVEDFSKSIEREERRQKKIVERLEALKNQ